MVAAFEALKTILWITLMLSVLSSKKFGIPRIPRQPSIDRKFYIDQENICLGVEKAKISPQSPKTECGAQNQYSRVIYPLFGNNFGKSILFKK
jgi:hypothetical protein